MSWNIQWRPQNAYDVKSVNDKSTAEVLNELQTVISSTPTEISVSQPAPTIRGEVPYADIIDALKRGKVIPFLGAGVPLSNRSSNTDWNAGGNFLPSGVELARYLAKRSGMPVWHLRDTENLARVASYFKVSNQNVTLAQELSKIFNRGQPTDTHKLIAALAGKQDVLLPNDSKEPLLLVQEARRPLLIITTNYDLLMEKALEGMEYDRVIHYGTDGDKCSVLLWKHEWAQPKAVTDQQLRASIDLAARTVLYKMHGSIDTPGVVETMADGEEVPDQGTAVEPPPVYDNAYDEGADTKDGRFVITEENYVEFLAKINAMPPAVPSLFKEYFESRSFLFLGYSLDDWNLRVILHSLEDVLLRNSVRVDQNASESSSLAYRYGLVPQRRHWAIQRDPTEYDAAVWRCRNVKIGNRDLNNFVTEVLDYMQGLRVKQE